MFVTTTSTVSPLAATAVPVPPSLNQLMLGTKGAGATAGLGLRPGVCSLAETLKACYGGSFWLPLKRAELALERP